MTVIVGIKCTDAIALACDSRTSDPATGVGKDNARKLHIIECADGNKAVIGEAGNDTFSARAIEIVKAKAKEVKLTHYRALADAVDSAVSELKDMVRKQYKGSAEELQRYFMEFDFALIIAHYFDETPEIFTLDFSVGVTKRHNQKSVSIGCGGLLADFLLAQISVDDFDGAHGIGTGIYIVEEIKTYDIRCGGQTRSALILPQNGSSKATLDRQEWSEETTTYIKKFQERKHAEWKKDMRRIIHKLAARRTKRMNRRAAQAESS